MTAFGLTTYDIFAIAVIIIGFITGYVRLQMRVSQNARAAEDAIRVAREARDLVHAFRVDVAKEYASAQMLRDVDNRVGGAIQSLSDRIDEVLKTVAKHPRS